MHESLSGARASRAIEHDCLGNGLHESTERTVGMKSAVVRFLSELHVCTDI